LLCVDYYRAAKIAENWIKLDLAKRMHYWPTTTHEG
jgi:hypothetical protein